MSSIIITIRRITIYKAIETYIVYWIDTNLNLYCIRIISMYYILKSGGSAAATLSNYLWKPVPLLMLSLMSLTSSLFQSVQLINPSIAIRVIT